MKGKSVADISNELSIARATVHNCAERYRPGDIDRALFDGARTGCPRRITKESADWIRHVAAESLDLSAWMPRVGRFVFFWNMPKPRARHTVTRTLRASRARLGELLQTGPKSGKVPDVLAPWTVSLAWHQFSLYIEERPDGLGCVAPDMPGSADGFSIPPISPDAASITSLRTGFQYGMSAKAERPRLSLDFLTALNLSTGRSFFKAGRRSNPADMKVFLMQIESLVPPDVIIKLMNPSGDSALPDETKQWLFTRIGRFAFVNNDRLRYGLMLQPLAGYAVAAALSAVRTCRGRTPLELQESILTTLSRAAK